MPLITREDGERFVIPSYRDILATKKNAMLKREIMMLSANYGEYITFQKKNNAQVEVAFSPDLGYLLGESVWNHFKRPYDMIYCEAVANSTDAILVIVKSGSVYLDGSFPLDTIIDELVIFKSQQNSFSIYVHGDVPISEHPVEGKISFDAGQVREFSILEEPVFPSLVGIKAFQLQPVDAVLKQNNIGVLPLKKMLMVFAIPLVLFMAYNYLASSKTTVVPTTFVFQSNPYEEFQALMTTPDPVVEIKELLKKIYVLYSAPGWMPTTISYLPGASGSVTAKMVSHGAYIQVLQTWAKANNATVDLKPDGLAVTLRGSYVPSRVYKNTISKTQDIIANILDRLSFVLPPNSLNVDNIEAGKSFTKMDIIITLPSSPPGMIETVANTLNNLPLSLSKVNLTVMNGNISGTLTFKAVGN